MPGAKGEGGAGRPGRARGQGEGRIRWSSHREDWVVCKQGVSQGVEAPGLSGLYLRNQK